MNTLREEFAYNLKVRMASENTIVAYTKSIRLLEDWLKEKYNADFATDTVTGMMLSHWAGSIAELKPSTRKLYHTAVTSYLNFLFNAQAIKNDLAKAVPDIGSLELLYKKQPDARPDKEAYSVEEVRLMLSTPSRNQETTLRNHALIAVLVSSGLRIFEALQLNVGDIYGDNEIRVARKGSFGNKLPVTVPEQVREYTDPYIEFRKGKGESVTDDSPLFANINGERIAARVARASIAELQKKLGLQTGLHTFRHTALTETGKFADAATARDLAGQKSINVTNRYLHSTEDERKQAASHLASTIFGKDEPKDTSQPTLEELNRKIEAQQKLIEELLAKLSNNVA